jgi:hypothetical protein
MLAHGFVEPFVPPLCGGIGATLKVLLPAPASFDIGTKPLVFPTMNGQPKWSIAEMTPRCPSSERHRWLRR